MGPDVETVVVTSMLVMKPPAWTESNVDNNGL